MKLFRKLKRNKEKMVKHFYRPHETCQIKKLNWLYEKHFGLINDGVFVEVGAFDGEYVSNTSCLADLGWRGYYIEPVPEYYEKCKKRHVNNVSTKVFNFAIGHIEEYVKINISGVLSSIDKNTTKKFMELSWAKHLITSNEVEVQQVTLDSFLTKQNIGKNIDLISIDVEGYELNVLKGFDIGYWQPKMVIIELHDQNLDYKDTWDIQDEIVLYIESKNYRVVYKDFTNTVYVRN